MMRSEYAKNQLSTAIPDLEFVNDEIRTRIGLTWAIDADDPRATHADAVPVLNVNQLVAVCTEVGDEDFADFIAALGVAIATYRGFIRMDGWHVGIDRMVAEIMEVNHPEHHHALTRIMNPT